MSKKRVSKKQSFEKRDDDEMEELEDYEKNFNPDSLDDVLDSEEEDTDEEDEELFDEDDDFSLDEENEEDDGLYEDDDEENAFWKL